MLVDTQVCTGFYQMTSVPNRQQYLIRLICLLPTQFPKDYLPKNKLVQFIKDVMQCALDTQIPV